MIVGVPKEIKVEEYRVGLTPEAAAELVRHGHDVIVETNAGVGIEASDDDYLAVGARIIPTAEAVFEQAELIVKVKEPQAVECARLKPHQTLFTYLHLAADKPQAEALMKSGATCIAYETVTDKQGRLPLLMPMSQVAGRMATQAAATALQRSEHGGRGTLMGGVPGVRPAKVIILGGGVSGTHAAEMAIGMRADVTVFDRYMPRLAELDVQFAGALKTAYSLPSYIEKAVAEADVVIGAVLIPGASAPKLVTKAMLKTMKPGAVLIDIAIDQGGCFETSRPTTHQNPIFVEDGILHYCVANMPGAVPRTSTYALNNMTLPFTLALANKGTKQALNDDTHLAEGLNVADNFITYETVANDLNLPYKKPDWLN
ncbi:alanine dehydrogenase [Hirschia baltica]|uniref:Alanine dehydrogenase n=1 Tax=Hirschia baltica (strain ATCC 49814 / DSM 5838 / IFAM 1418) TaxID=582402 RepID=C6XNT3_HIRBI|nr:alanine dehydrogenase [Hirschia baltica]ACT58336.1 alanine dehydrogenase [Hirschia baltica ATCC 49814]